MIPNLFCIHSVNEKYKIKDMNLSNGMILKLLDDEILLVICSEGSIWTDFGTVLTNFFYFFRRLKIANNEIGIYQN